VNTRPSTSAASPSSAASPATSQQLQSTAGGPAARAELAGRHLVEVGGAAPSVELGQVAGCTNATRRTEMLQLMRAQGWITSARGTVRLSHEGWARWSALVPDTGAGQVLDRALAGWPYAHRAFLELLLSATVARHHLGTEHPDTHLGFMAIGETGTGKSVMAELVVRLLGLDSALAIVDLPAQSVSAVLGRRERVEGGEVRLIPSPFTRQPFLLLDEADKADPDVRRRAWSYFQGKTRVTVGGEVYELAPTPMLAANPTSTRGTSAGDRYAALRPEYRRRSVVLDTGYMRGHDGQLERLMRTYDAGPAATDRLSLARLAPPDRHLSAAGHEVLESLREVLTEAGREEFPGVRFLATAALGRAALMGTRDHALAAYATGCSYLWATETVPGQVIADWVLPVAALREYLGAEAEVLVEAMARARAGREDRRRQEDQRRRDAQLSRDLTRGDVLEARGALLAQLEQVRQGIAGHQLYGASTEVKSRAKGLRDRLADLRERASAAATGEDVRAAATAAQDAIQRAQQLRAEQLARRQAIEEEKAEAVRQRQLQEEQDRHLRRQQKAIATARREQLRADLRRCQEVARPLEQAWARVGLRPGEEPLQVLSALRVEGRPLLSWEPPQPPQTDGRGWISAALKYAVTSEGGRVGTWRIEVPTPGGPSRFAGSAESCAALRTWGPATRAVLFEVLRHLHVVEDGLADQLGIPARGRRRRPRVDGAAIAGAVRRVGEPLPGRPRQLGRGTS
jgi:hypothetical protein